MVQVREQTYVNAQGDADLSEWISQLSVSLAEDDVSRVTDACELVRLAGEKPAVDTTDWAQTSDCFLAGLDIAHLLADYT